MTERPMPNSQHPTSKGPEFWEGRYLEEDTPWDKGAAAPPLLEYLVRNVVTGSICVPGCGAGHDVRALAAQGAVVTGLDIAPSALQRAESFPKVNDEHYIQADFLELSPNRVGAFDWIFEHTCFCAIDPLRRSDYVDSCVNALKSGGRLLAIFFMNPDTEVGEGPPFGTTEQELGNLFAPHFDLREDYLPHSAYSGREGRECVRVLERKT